MAPNRKRRGKRLPPSTAGSLTPTLTLSRSTVTLAATTDDTATVQAIVTAQSGNGGALGGVGLGTIVEDSGSGWLSASVQGSFPALVTVVCDPTGLTAATYTGTVPITDPRASNSPQNISVTFTVSAGVVPSLVISNPTMALSVQQGNAATTTATCVITSGTSANLGTLSVGTITGTGATGVSASISGNVVTVTGASAALTSASSPYTATVPIVDATASNSPQNITVTLNVTAVSPPVTPVMALSSPSVAWTVTEGTSASRSATVTVSASNGAPLGTTSVGTITGTGAADVTATVSGHVVTVSFALATLAAGTFSAVVPIANSTASNSPLNFTVNLTVSAAPSSSYDINADVHLLDSTAGAGVFVGGGWPLRPGDLMPADVSSREFSVFVNGAEQSCFVEAMPGLFPDGSVRALLVQFLYDIPNSTPISAQVKMRTIRTTTDLSPVPMTPQACWSVTTGYTWGSEGRIKAKLLPRDPSYLCETDVTFQPLIPSAQHTPQEVARFDTFMAARSNGLRTVTTNKDSSTVQTFRSTYDSPRALLAFWQRTGNVTWYQDAMQLIYRMTEWVFPGPAYTGYNPNPNIHGESRFTQVANADWKEEHSQRLWSYAAAWQLTGYSPFYTRVNASHMYDNRSGRSTQAGALQLAGSAGYIDPTYGIRQNVFRVTRPVVGYAIGANRRMSTPSGAGNRNMIFPTELPFIIDALATHVWNRAGDWRNGVTGIYYGNSDGTNNNAPHAEDFPTFQLSLINHFYMMYERHVKADSRIPALIKANVDALLLNSRALISGDTGFGIASYGSPYWMNRNGPASQGAGGAATPVYLVMDAAAIAYCAARYPTDVIAGADYATWYNRALDPEQNKYVQAIQAFDWNLFNNGWKIYGEQFGNSQAGPYFMRNGVPTGPATINSLAVPTTFPR